MRAVADVFLDEDSFPEEEKSGFDWIILNQIEHLNLYRTLSADLEWRPTLW